MTAPPPGSAGPSGTVVHHLPVRPFGPGLTLLAALDIVRPLAHAHDDGAALVGMHSGNIWSDGTSWAWFLSFILPRRRAELHYSFDVHVEQDGLRETAWPTVTENLRAVGGHVGWQEPARLPEPVTDSPALLARFVEMGADLVDGSREPFLTSRVTEGVPVWQFTDCSDRAFERPMRPPA